MNDSPPGGLAWDAIERAPAPVRRYLRRVLQDGAVPVTTARFTQRGRLRTGSAAKRWMAFDALHVVRPARTEFVWTADVQAFGPLHLRVIDSLQAGRGAGEVKALSVWRVAASTPCHEMDCGALHRFLAEAVWYPTALVPGPRLRWTAIDETRALATLSIDTASVALEFRFDGDDQVASIYTPARWGRFGRRFEQHGWEGHFSRYQWIDGLRVPRHGDVGWFVGAQWACVWEGDVVTADYEWGVGPA